MEELRTRDRVGVEVRFEFCNVTERNEEKKELKGIDDA